jgi:simple sugar transport system substrate-binding protein
MQQFLSVLKACQRTTGWSLVVLLACSLFLIGSCGRQEDRLTIPTVVKLTTTPWFKRMEVGIKRFGSETGHNCYLVGPPRADATLQVQIIEDLIDEGVDAIAVVPFSPETLDPVLEKAMDRGLVVVTHEASDQQHCNYDIEAFDNARYGAHLMTRLAECMGGKGAYAVFVGNLSSRTHNEWVDSAIAYQEQLFPEMELIGSRSESFDDAVRAYGSASQILDRNPDIRGLLGTAATDVVGIGRAVAERSLEAETCVVGTSLPSIAGTLLATGSIDMISFWDPADAGYVMNLIAVKALQGETIRSGDDLGVDGYRDIRVTGSVIYGNAWIDVDIENASQYPF